MEFRCRFYLYFYWLIFKSTIVKLCFQVITLLHLQRIRTITKYYTSPIRVCDKRVWLYVKSYDWHFFLLGFGRQNVRRRFRASKYQSTTRVKPFICTMPMRLDDGWNQVSHLQNKIWFLDRFLMILHISDSRLTRVPPTVKIPRSLY